jgi:hypothetical protein
MKKKTIEIVGIFIFAFLIFLSNPKFAFSFNANLDSLFEIQIGNIQIKNVTEEKITGTFSLNNPTDIYFSKLHIGTELYYMADEESSNLINKEFTTIVLPKRQSYTYEFEHRIPYNIPFGSYDFLLRLYSQSGTPLNLASQSLKDIGKPSEPFITNDPVYSYLLQNEEKIDDPLSGPNYNPLDDSIFVLLLENLSNQDINIIPTVTVYDRSYVLNPTPIEMQEGIGFPFKAREKKEVRISLPKIQKPGSYLASVSFLNQDNRKQISPNFEARYVISGLSAKILDHFAITNSASLSINTVVVGPADGSEIGEASLKVTSYEATSKKQLYEESFPINKLHEDPITITTHLPINPNIDRYLVRSEIIYSDEVLDSTLETYDLNMINKTQPSSNSQNITNNDSDKTSTSPTSWILFVLVVLVIIGVAIWKIKKK